VASARKSILLVEDDADLREAIATSIVDLGVAVQQACDGVEGLECLASGPPPSAILLDLWMPRLDGRGFLAAVRAEPAFAHIPVVTMTGGPDSIPQGEDVASRLHKPFDIQELAQILVSLCASDPPPGETPPG
jgi:two-component system chemotaxis response regulator CheY